MEILINAANILYVTAYFTMDMLRLRILTVTAACCLAVYFYSQPVSDAERRRLERVLHRAEPDPDRAAPHRPISNRLGRKLQRPLRGTDNPFRFPTIFC